MILTHEFEVAAPVEKAWPVLTDIPRVARCLPGAALESSDGDLHRGSMTAKIGPITATYSGTAAVQETDEDTRTVVMHLEAREARGQGMASAVITNRLEARGNRTLVTVETDLKMSGAHAQFGRGILQSVAGSMIKQFAGNLEAEIAREGSPTDTAADRGGDAAAQAATHPAAAAHPSAAVAPLDVRSLLPGLVTPRTVLLSAGALGLALFLRRRPQLRRIELHLHLYSHADEL